MQNETVLSYSIAIANFTVCIINISLFIYWTFIKPRIDQKKDKHVVIKRLGSYTITCPLTMPMKHGTKEMEHHYTLFKNVETDSVYAIDSYEVQNRTEDGKTYTGQVYYYGVLRQHELLIQVNNGIWNPIC